MGHLPYGGCPKDVFFFWHEFRRKAAEWIEKAGRGIPSPPGPTPCRQEKSRFFEPRTRGLLHFNPRPQAAPRAAWGGLEFESRHSDQRRRTRLCATAVFLSVEIRTGHSRSERNNPVGCQRSEKRLPTTFSQKQGGTAREALRKEVLPSASNARGLTTPVSNRIMTKQFGI